MALRTGWGLSVVSAALLCAGNVAAQTNSNDNESSEPAAEESSEASAPESTGLDELDLSRLIDPEVRSASLVAEPVSEAPAPVTVITSDMIEAIGARNLQEVLAAYVPGVTVVSDKNELNVAMRGIYTDSQQKMLVLVDGHRINSRLFSSAAPDFSIGIHPSKVQQIEVLRGPGSALYGNLALNGVINIVTKDAADMSTAAVEAGLGTLGQRTLSATSGQDLGNDRAVKVWGTLYQAEGEVVRVPAEEQFNKIDDPEPDAYLNGFKDPASFDVGGQLKLGDISLSLGARQGKMVPPFSSGKVQGGQTYDYEEFRPWNGVAPGLMSRSTHSELAYDASLGKFVDFHTGIYFDTNSTVQRLVLETRTSGADQRLSTVIGQQESTIGNLSHLRLGYDGGTFGEGSFLIGGQIDRVAVIDSYWITGSEGDLKTVNGTAERPVLPPGNETIYSAFSQIKHAVGLKQDVIFNLGVRYDYKDRHDYLYENEFLEEEFEVGDDIYAISPRLAMILAPESWFGVKFSFSDSFVDAPYFNRTNRTRNDRGTPTLEPERMRAYQLTPTIRAFGDQLRNSTNFYYLEHNDIIFRKPDAEPSEPIFENSGELVIAGVENEITFLEDDYRLRAAISFQKPLHWTVYPVTDGQIDNVPLYFASAVADFKPLWWMTDDVWLGINGRYYSEQTSPIDIFYLVQRSGRGAPPVTREFNEPDNRVDDYFLLRATLRWNQIADTDLHASLTVDDILGTTYYQGGTTAHPYRQPGRWFMVRVGYDFDI
jgi:iron complex outermembrane receptor protein